MSKKIDKANIAGIELRHVAYCVDKKKENDLLVLNEYIHTKDGERVKNLRLLKNYKRKFWVVKPGRRDFEESKQWMDLEDLDEYESTQCQLYKNINRALRINSYSNKDAFNSPYVYGCGTTLQSEIKNEYYSRWSEFVTPSSEVAVLDTETDVIHGHDQIILCTITYKNRIFCAVLKTFLNQAEEEYATKRIRSTVDEHLGDVLKQRGVTLLTDEQTTDKTSGLEVAILDSPGQLVNACIQKAHEWRPDFLEFWNIHFDMTKMIRALETDGYDLAEVFSDPRIPKEFRWFNWREGPSQKTIRTGATMPISPAERWHIANAPCTFFMVCGMTTYYRLRIAKGKLSGGYGLDATLSRHGKLGKLKFDKVTSKKLRWHQEMQHKYPYVYIAYNIMDCIAVELLDEDIQDFDMKFNTKCVVADYTEFKSGPQMASVKMNYLVKRYNKRWGTCGGSMEVDVDKLTVEVSGWPLTLPAYLVEDSPVKVMTDWTTPSSLIYFNVSDLDISATYPAVQVMLNISKSTTTREVVAIQKLTKEKRNQVFMDTVCGVSSSLAVSSTGFNLPNLYEIEDEFDAYLEPEEVTA